MSDRNFRSSYLEKVGIKGIEEKKSLELVLKEQPIDSGKLAQFCLRFTIPSAYRIYVWKILLGVLPTSTDAHDFVLQQRQEQYNDLSAAVSLLNRTNQDQLQDQKHLNMMTLEQTWLPPDSVPEDAESQVFLALSRTMDGLCEEGPAEVYWMTRNLFQAHKAALPQLSTMIEMVECWLRKEETDGGTLRLHLSSLNALHLLPLQVWFESCFAEVLPLASIERIWDKVVAGSYRILVAVAVAIFVTFRRPILSFQGIEDIKRYLQHIPEDTGDIIVGEGLKLFHKHAGPSQAESGCERSPQVSHQEQPQSITRMLGSSLLITKSLWLM